MNSTDFSVFTYQSQPVRTVSIDGEPWFVLKDVCEAMGISDHKSVPRRLEEDEVDLTHLTDSMGRNQQTTVVNEPGLYNVILRSDKPEARAFKRWITHEVLPALRRTGEYKVQPKPMTQIELLAAQAQAMVELERKTDALTQRMDAQQQTIEKAVSVFSLPTVEKEHWRDEMNSHISSICERYSQSYSAFRGETYKELEEVAGVCLSARVKRMQDRMKKGGAKYKDRAAVTKLHVISEDQKLRSIYEAIVRKFESKLMMTGRLGA